LEAGGLHDGQVDVRGYWRVVVEDEKVANIGIVVRGERNREEGIVRLVRGRLEMFLLMFCNYMERRSLR